MTNLPKSASPSEAQPAEILVRKCMEAAVMLAFRRHNIEPEEDTATVEEIAADAAGACFGEETCSDEPIPELQQLLKIWAAEPRREATDSINYLEIHHTDGRVKVWYGDEAQGRFKGIDHDHTTKEEWKRMAGEGVRTIEALTANSGERQAEREAAMDAIERVIEMADSYKTASQMTLSDARNALKYFRASAAPLKQTGWVSVKDRMPHDNPKQSWHDHGTYRASEIVIAFNGFQTTAEVLTNPKGESSWVAGDQTLTGVTHWHELPDDPHAASQPQPSAGQMEGK